ncbi:outer membrane efflux protein [Anaerobacterium chartisolvens]|uniref:Outer membrane efflux protein n=1 Tax=Anaerobacterium chartisolvens TaxID=1297424 RepID=A0A369AEL5_9FIRM|nr:TolC family protein [Anaerobacterium chartisolvens]RCX07802.1 outer membrane efflux protein [Anaerobacterium chartisolvens]
MKKIIPLLLALCLLVSSSSVFADDGDVSKLTVNDVVSKALEYDQQDQVKAIEIRFKGGEVEDAVKNAENPYRTEAVEKEYKALSTVKQKIWKTVIPDEERFALEKLRKEFEINKKRVEAEAVYLYYKALLLNERTKLHDEERAFAEEKYKILQDKYKLGQISQVALKDGEIQYLQKESDIAAELSDRNYAYDDLKEIMGVEAGELNLAYAEVKESTLPEYAKEALVDLLKKNDLTYVAALKDLEFKQRRYDLYQSTITTGIDKEKINAEKDLSLAGIELKKVERDEIVASYAEYMSLQNAKADLEKQRKSLELEKLKLSQNEVKYKAGMIPSIDYKEPILAYKQAELKLKQDINEYNYKISSFMVKIKA